MWNNLIHASLRLSDTLDFMHVDYKIVVMILVGCVLAIARSTGTLITHWRLLIPYKHTYRGYLGIRRSLLSTILTARDVGMAEQDQHRGPAAPTGLTHVLRYLCRMSLFKLLLILFLSELPPGGVALS